MTDIRKTGVGRRTVLKAGAAAIGSGAITGFPSVMAQEPVTLRCLGTAVNQSKEIADKVRQDLGITIEYVPVTTDEVAKRVLTEASTFDIVDSEYFPLKKLLPSGNLMGMDARRIKEFDDITPVFTKDELDGRTIGNQGTAPRCSTCPSRSPPRSRPSRPSGSR